MSAPNSLYGLSAPGAQVAASGDWRAMYVWADNRPTTEPRLDDDGLPLWRLDAMLFFAGGSCPVSIETGSKVAPASVVAGMYVLSSISTITVMGPRAGARGLTVTVHLPASALSAFAAAHSPAAVKAV